MPVLMPKCLQVYQMLDGHPMTASQIAVLVEHHDATVHAWLKALHTCGLVQPVAHDVKSARRRGPFTIVWDRTDHFIKRST